MRRTRLRFGLADVFVHYLDRAYHNRGSTATQNTEVYYFYPLFKLLYQYIFMVLRWKQNDNTVHSRSNKREYLIHHTDNSWTFPTVCSPVVGLNLSAK